MTTTLSSLTYSIHKCKVASLNPKVSSLTSRGHIELNYSLLLIIIMQSNDEKEYMILWAVPAPNCFLCINCQLDVWPASIV